MITEARKRRKPTTSGVEQPYPGDRVRFIVDRLDITEGIVLDHGPGSRDYWVHGGDERIHLVKFTTTKERREGLTTWTSTEITAHQYWRKPLLDNLNNYMYAYAVRHSAGSSGSYLLWHVDQACHYAKQGERIDGSHLSVLTIIRAVKTSQSQYSFQYHPYCPTCVGLT